MRAADDILRRAKRLSRDELAVLVSRLEEQLSRVNGRRPTRNGSNKRAPKRSRSVHPTAGRTRSKESYSHTLALSGIARSGSTDVSSHKGKYLADAYSARREE